MPTKKRTIEEGAPEIEFSRKDALFAMNAGFKKQPGSFTAWQRDQNKIVLFCADKIVGTCVVNMESYIDKTPVVERAVITAPTGKPVGGVALTGNTTRYPESFVEFRITVSSRDGPEPGTALRVGSVFEKTRVSSGSLTSLRTPTGAGSDNSADLAN